MEKILIDHATTAHSTYHVLLQISESTGMCRVRLPIILAWIRELKMDARSCHDAMFIKLKLAALNLVLRSTGDRKLKKAATDAEVDMDFA